MFCPVMQIRSIRWKSDWEPRFRLRQSSFWIWFLSFPNPDPFDQVLWLGERANRCRRCIRGVWEKISWSTGSTSSEQDIMTHVSDNKTEWYRRENACSFKTILEIIFGTADSTQIPFQFGIFTSNMPFWNFHSKVYIIANIFPKFVEFRMSGNHF